MGENDRRLDYYATVNVDDICEGCPLRSGLFRSRETDFQIDGLYFERQTRLMVTDLGGRYDNFFEGLRRRSDTKIVTLKTGDIDETDIEYAFSECQQPVRLERRVLPDKIICG